MGAAVNGVYVDVKLHIYTAHVWISQATHVLCLNKTKPGNEAIRQIQVCIVHKPTAGIHV